jgi:hypothetical protein
MEEQTSSCRLSNGQVQPSSSWFGVAAMGGPQPRGGMS